MNASPTAFVWWGIANTNGKEHEYICLVPRPCPAFHPLQYRKVGFVAAETGAGLGMRLRLHHKLTKASAHKTHEQE